MGGPIEPGPIGPAIDRIGPIDPIGPKDPIGPGGGIGGFVAPLKLKLLGIELPEYGMTEG